MYQQLQQQRQKTATAEQDGAIPYTLIQSVAGNIGVDCSVIAFPEADTSFLQLAQNANSALLRVTSNTESLLNEMSLAKAEEATMIEPRTEASHQR